MKSVCILTDSTIQFPQPTFSGRHLVKIVPFSPDLPYPEEFKKEKISRTSERLLIPGRILVPKREGYTEEALARWLISPETQQPYDQVLAVFTSSYISPLFSTMQSVAASWMGKCTIQVVDSLTTSFGLGLIVQAAAEGFSRGDSLSEIEHTVRSLIPHIYSVICTPNLSYLYHSGIIDIAQAVVGEILSLMPVFVIEEGMLSPLEKVKNQRQVVDLFQEFIDEFDHLQHIAFFQGTASSPQVGRLLREHASTSSPRTPFTEHNINLALANLFGPQTSGVTVIETV